jgi:hypothetical protein
MGRLFRNGLKTVAVVMGNIRGGFVERCWESLTACARAKNCNLLALPGEVDLQAGMTAARCDEAYAFARAGYVDGVVVLGSTSGWWDLTTAARGAGKQLPDLGVSRYLLSLFASPEELEPAEKQLSLFDRVSTATCWWTPIRAHCSRCCPICCSIR